ncbi:hypothetical protein [Streptomyces alkaliterrae]|uniref:Translation initiation factor 2 n=1 Tax=Streptomyces alkaliterrae TaxID=2213162 RepID=A0A5P0YLP8_9ACTN|nr:hypothetical protein [Streptomyces alkaliterrae]MQS01181.1 hypothetical protein [Streptomyces alkaliterrae]
MAGDYRADWLRVPVGEDATRWATRSDCHRVLAIVHNVTSATRLLDVLPLFRDDLRIQLLATCTGSSPFQSGVAELLATLGVPVLPWEQALSTPVSLALSASLGGELGGVPGPVVVLSHGVGYNKRLATPDTGHRTPDTGHRTPDTGHRTPDTGPVFGMSPEWLLADGEPVAARLVLSHPEQLARLRRYCPQAAPRAVLAGDPCFDRLLKARPNRERYRRALGVRPGQRLVVLNSTWNAESLFGDGEQPHLLGALLDRLTSELPVDDYRLAAVLHPNIWHGHGPGQVRAWLDRAQRCGLTLIDPTEDWRQALVAADAVIGDFGSVSYYAAAIGVPVLMAAPGADRLDADSPVAEFVRTAPPLDLGRPLAAQLADVIAGHRPHPSLAEQASSAPGRSAALLRRTFYDLIRIPEPDRPAALEPLPLPPYRPARPLIPLLVRTGRQPDGTVLLRRHVDPAAPATGYDSSHLAVHEDTLETHALEIADLVFRDGSPDDPRLGGPARWTAELLRARPHVTLAVFVTGPDSCVLRVRAGQLLDVRTAPHTADPLACASALLGWLADGGSVRKLAADGLWLCSGGQRHRAEVTPLEG